MRLSHALLRTQKDVANDAELPSHQLILRAGLARRLASGIYSITPLAYRAVLRMEAIIREEMERIGGQEALLPVVQPADLWQESGRYDLIGADLARLRDRADHPMVLAMTHEEAVTDLARSIISSYRQLPQMVFQLQTKFRDEPRPRGGLVRLREFLMKDAYSFHATQNDLDAYYEQVIAAYLAIFRRVGVPVLVVQSDTGIMGGKTAHEFMLLADGGEDTLIVCPNGDYAANREIAVAGPSASSSREHAAILQPTAEIHTPGATTIAALCAAAGCAPSQTLKAVFYAAGESEVVMALIRGDLEVNEIKLRNLLGQEMRPLTAAEAEANGLVAGYAGPVNLQASGAITLVADTSVVVATNLIAGANRHAYHLSGVNYGRDFTAQHVGDIALVAAGEPCARCGAALEARRGIEAANTFKLGTRYSETMGATFIGEDGAARPMAMGCYGLGITRLLACVLEASHDDKGIIWPVSVAPYQAHLVALGALPEVTRAADDLYETLGAAQTLYDDRPLSAGVKFADADLLGAPARVTISTRSLAAGGAEVRARRTGEMRIVALADALAAIARVCAADVAGG